MPGYVSTSAVGVRWNLDFLRRIALEANEGGAFLVSTGAARKANRVIWEFMRATVRFRLTPANPKELQP